MSSQDEYAPLKTDRDFLEQIIDTIADPVFVKDELHRWQLLNEAACTLMGHPREVLLGRTDHDFFPQEEADVFHAMDNEVFRTGDPNVNEEVITREGAPSRMIVTKKTVFRDKRGRRFLVGTVRDVTEVQQAQRKLTQAQVELEALLAKRTEEAAEARKLLLHSQKMDTLGELAGGIAHDFNNLLAVVSASLELIVRKEGEGGEHHRVGLEALKAVQRGSALTRRMLDFSRQRELTLVPASLSTLVGGVELLLARSLDASITLRTKIEAELVVTVDHAQMEAALLNLCINARNAMPEGGALSLHVTSKSVNEALGNSLGVEAGAYALIEVSDEGVGMTPAVAARACEPFFTTRSEGGTGLGLSMAKAFAAQAKGALTLESQLGEGTAVRLYLPLSEGAPEAPKASRTNRGPTGGRVVLVVDDDPHLQAVLTRSLGVLGHEAYGASSIAEAQRVGKELGTLDVLVTDIVLGREQDGPALASELRKTHPKLHAIFMSGYVSPDAESHAEVLQKPFPIDRLEGAIQRLGDTRATS